MQAKSRSLLIRKQKVRIRTEFSRRLCLYEKTVAAAVPAWAKSEFNLHVLPDVTTMKWVSREKKDTLQRGKTFHAIRVNCGTSHVLERQIYHRICPKRYGQTYINGSIFWAQTQRLRTSLNESASWEQGIFLNYSEGLLTNLKCRWGLKVF